MSKITVLFRCENCVRFDRPRREGDLGTCTQTGEDTNPKTRGCYWYVERRRINGEKEKDES